jgi:hypothetical protein
LEETPRVTPLKQVRLAVESAAKATGPAAVSSEVALIYGIGVRGLPPFECLLTDKREGDAISFQVATAEAEDFFGHLAARFLAFFGPAAEAFFRARIIRIETPEPREVIKAIAETTGHGHGGGCDCGCGCR